MKKRENRGRKPLASRQDWLTAAVSALTLGGVGAVRVERLARDLGVTKGSFYHYFEGRDALLQALLAAWLAQGTAAVIDAVESVPGDAATRLAALWRLAHGGTREDAELDLSIRVWARDDPRARRAVEQVDSGRLGYLRRLFRQAADEAGGPVDPLDVEARCLLLYSLLIGDNFIAKRHGRLGRADVVARAVTLLIDDGHQRDRSSAP